MNFQTAYNTIEENKKLRYQIMRELDAQYKADIAELFSELFPKARPEKLKQFSDLSGADKDLYVYMYKFNKVVKIAPARQSALYNKYSMIYAAKSLELSLQNDDLNRFMRDNVPTEYPQTKDYNLIKIESADNYRSQGWGACKYALAPIKYYASLLDKAGIPFEIRTTNIIDGRDNYGNSYHYENYELWAKCEKWVYEAIFINLGNIDDWEKSDYNNGVNSRVYTGG